MNRHNRMDRRMGGYNQQQPNQNYNQQGGQQPNQNGQYPQQQQPQRGMQRGGGQPNPRNAMCQSCMLPLQRRTGIKAGTFEDGTKTLQYCSSCFKDGKWVKPDAKVLEIHRQARREILTSSDFGLIQKILFTCFGIFRRLGIRGGARWQSKGALPQKPVANPQQMQQQMYHQNPQPQYQQQPQQQYHAPQQQNNGGYSQPPVMNVQPPYDPNTAGQSNPNDITNMSGSSNIPGIDNNNNNNNHTNQ